MVKYFAMMKRISYSWFAAALLGVVLGTASCANNDELRHREKPQAPVTTTFRLSFKGSQASKLVTYATPGTEPENRINEIDLLLFDETDKYVERFSLSSSYFTDATADAKYVSFSANLQIGRYNSVVVLANCTAELDKVAGLRVGVTKESFLPNLVEVAPFDGKLEVSGFPMWGELNNLVVEDDMPLVAEIALTRMVAKVSVDASYVISDFKLTEIWIYNVVRSGKIVPDSASWDASIGYAIRPSMQFPIPPKVGNDKDTTRILKYTGYTYNNRNSAGGVAGGAPNPSYDIPLQSDTISWNGCNGYIYLYEINNRTEANPQKATSMILAGYYQGRDKLSYYTVPLVSEKGPVDILRNHHYKVFIDEISGPGFGSFDEVLNQPTDIVATVKPWTDDDVEWTVPTGGKSPDDDDEEVDNSVPATGVLLDKEDITLQCASPGNIDTLRASVLPSTATNKRVNWSIIPATGVAEIVKIPALEGTDTAVLIWRTGPGTAVVTATTASGKFVASCNIVSDVCAVPATGLTLKNANDDPITNTTVITLFVGQDTTVYADVTPDNAADGAVYWSSADDDKVTATQSGAPATAPWTNQAATILAQEVTPPEGVLITATCNGGAYGPLTQTFRVKVLPIHTIDLILKDDPARTADNVAGTTIWLIVGETKTIYADVMPPNTSNGEVTMTSANNIVTATQNAVPAAPWTDQAWTITGVAPSTPATGPVTVTATVEGIEATFQVHVLAAVPYFSVTGGYTGSARINYYNSTDALDVLFIRNGSLWYDATLHLVPPGRVESLTLTAPTLGGDMTHLIGRAAPDATYPIGLNLAVTGVLVLRPDNSSGHIPIGSYAELQLIGADDVKLSDTYGLEADLDMMDVSFTPLGNNSLPFTGIFDGGGKELENLKIEKTGEDYVGLFGRISTGRVENLSLVSGTVTGRSSVGGVVGSSGGTIISCHNRGVTVSGSAAYIGGVVGSSTGTITTCNNYTAVSGGNSFIGGVVGASDGTITTCYNNATVSGGGLVGGVVGSSTGTITGSYNDGVSVIGTGSNVGGVVGEADGSIINCRNRAAVSGVGNIGGVAGASTNNTTITDSRNEGGSVVGTGDRVGGVVGSTYIGSITNCRNDATVSGKGWVGGVVGSSSADITDSRNEGVSVVGTGDRVGGVVGSTDGNITTCYNTAKVRGDTHIGGVVGSTLGTITDSHNEGDSVVGTTSVGGVVGGATFAITDCHNTAAVTGTSDVGGVAGNSSGTITNSYNDGGNVAGANNVGGVVGNSTGDITGSYNDGGNVAGGNNVGGVVGNSTGAITGSYNDGGNVAGANNVGGVVGDITGDITDSHNDGGSVVGTDSRVGGVAGNSTGDITDSHNDGGNVTGGVNVGGVVGYMSGTNISNCHNTAAVTGTGVGYVGGVAGYSSGDITDCYNTAAVSGTGHNVGGVVGDIAGANISKCYNTAAVSGIDERVGGVAGRSTGTIFASYNTGGVSLTVGIGGAGGAGGAGGIVGYMNTGDITACYNTATVTGIQLVGGIVGRIAGDITACYNTGAVTGTGNYVGGVVGTMASNTISACYNTGGLTAATPGDIAGHNLGTGMDCYWSSSAAPNAQGSGNAFTDSAPFNLNIAPIGTSGNWGTGDGSGTGKYWKPNTVNGQDGQTNLTILPQLFFE
ncbi:hypothetical protein SAMD00024442_23_19 [Candidatus Symbiothrix dinenymphae]|nr:hypothetical protein SAMD00024442_23_19 [Candidatus Symbiothrix dinenymphae]